MTQAIQDAKSELPLERRRFVVNELARLREDGILTSDEFERARKRYVANDSLHETVTKTFIFLGVLAFVAAAAFGYLEIRNALSKTSEILVSVVPFALAYALGFLFRFRRQTFASELAFFIGAILFFLCVSNGATKFEFKPSEWVIAAMGTTTLAFFSRSRALWGAATVVVVAFLWRRLTDVREPLDVGAYVVVLPFLLLGLYSAKRGADSRLANVVTLLFLLWGFTVIFRANVFDDAPGDGSSCFMFVELGCATALLASSLTRSGLRVETLRRIANVVSLISLSALLAFISDADRRAGRSSFERYSLFSTTTLFFGFTLVFGAAFLYVVWRSRQTSVTTGRVLRAVFSTEALGLTIVPAFLATQIGANAALVVEIYLYLLSLCVVARFLYLGALGRRFEFGAGIVLFICLLESLRDAIQGRTFSNEFRIGLFYYVVAAVLFVVGLLLLKFVKSEPEAPRRARVVWTEPRELFSTLVENVGLSVVVLAEIAWGIRHCLNAFA